MKYILSLFILFGCAFEAQEIKPTGLNFTKISQPITSSTLTAPQDVIEIYIGGQSNCGAGTGDNIWQNYAPELQNGFTDVDIFNHVSGVNTFIPIPGQVNTLLGGSYTVRVGPILKIAEDARLKYPTARVRIFILYKGATSLAVNWAPGSGLRTTWFNKAKAMRDKNIAEGNNVLKRYMLWIQGEGDSDSLAEANAYLTNLNGFMSEFRTNFGSDAHVVISALSVNASTLKMPYKATIRQSQENFVAQDSVINHLINTDNLVEFPFVGGNVHYTTVGYTSIGKYFVEFL